MGSNEEDSSSPVSILRKASTPTSGISSQTPSRQRSSTTAGGGRDPANWKSYHNDANFPEQESAELAIPKFDVDPDIPLENMAALNRNRLGNSDSDSDVGKSTGLLIGDDLLKSNPSTQDEMQRKKERRMMQSLRRKQQAEENRIKAEEEARRRRLEEQEKEEEKLRKKEEERMRRDLILEQHRLKKDLERADDEVRCSNTPTFRVTLRFTVTDCDSK